MYRNQVAIGTSLVMVLSLLIGLCPCPIARGPVQSQTAEAHGCCTQTFAIRGTASNCCDAAAVQGPALAATPVFAIAVTSASANAVVLLPVAVRSASGMDCTRTAVIPRILRI